MWIDNISIVEHSLLGFWIIQSSDEELNENNFPEIEEILTKIVLKKTYGTTFLSSSQETSPLKNNHKKT